MLKFVELNLVWSKELPLEELRPWILNQLSETGEPLRWAITAIEPGGRDSLSRQLKLEGVVIIS